jgi:hypothetical protein
MNDLICPLCFNVLHNEGFTSYLAKIFSCNKCGFKYLCRNNDILCFYFIYDNIYYFITYGKYSNLKCYHLYKPDQDDIYECYDNSFIIRFEHDSFNINFKNVKELYNISISYIKNMVFL